MPNVWRMMQILKQTTQMQTRLVIWTMFKMEENQQNKDKTIKRLLIKYLNYHHQVVIYTVVQILKTEL